MNEYDLDIMRLGSQGYCCAQIMILLSLEMQGVENPSLVRAMAGLCDGCGTQLSTCGIMTGGACLLGYYAGKGLDEEENHDALPLMLEALSDWFQDYVGGQYGGITCAAIVPDGQPNPVICGGLVSACFEQIMRILMDHNLDPSVPRS